MLQPKILTTLRGYTRQQFFSDLISGIIVGIVALPLAIAFGIASGVSPEKGLITAVIAGFLISAFGGSRVQIGGPTGAFIVIVYSIVQNYGLDGLMLATLMAGFLLIAMGLLRLGGVIRYIPFPVIIGFTAGIAVIIFISQIKDFLGMPIDGLPADFWGKIILYFHHITTINWYAAGLGIFTLVVILIWPKITTKFPGSLVAILIATLAVHFFEIPVETIGSRFGSIPSTIPMPVLPDINLEKIQLLIQPAFTIAMLAAIESLLSATVADNMIGGTHRSNMELIAQGIANIASPIFGGIPATGAIARTATNVKNGGRTPIAGIVHSITLLLILLFFAKWANMIPMACLAGILVMVAYNMGDWHLFFRQFKGPRDEVLVLLTTFILTIVFDLTIAIEVGLLMAVFLLLRRLTQTTDIQVVNKELLFDNELDQQSVITIPEGVEVLEIDGPFFFGMAHKFEATQKRIYQKPPKVRILRLRKVPFIDATGLHHLRQFYQHSKSQQISLIISGINEQPLLALKKSGLYEDIGEDQIFSNINEALKKAGKIVSGTEIIPLDRLEPLS